MAKRAAAKSPAATGRIAVWFAVLMIAGAALTALPLCLVAVPGMMPSLAVFLADRQRPRYLSYAVTVMNFAGVLPFLLVLDHAGMSLAAAAGKLSDPFTWLVMYGAAASGWLINAGTVPLARICIEAQAGQRRRQLESVAKQMREEWGEALVQEAKETEARPG